MKKTVNESSAFPISGATVSGNTVYVSGQVGMDFEKGELVAGGIVAETEQALQHMQAQLEAAGSDKSLVLKTMVFMVDLAEYAVMNDVYTAFFERDFPARSAVAVAALPRDARVEIECVAELQ